MRDIDAIIDVLRRRHPGLAISQLQVGHPGADDDGLWFFRHPECANEAQLESPSGDGPFLFEDERVASAVLVTSVGEAVRLVCEALELMVPDQPGAP